MSEQAYKWKITFNTDIRKPAHEVIFSRKSIKANHAPVFFSDILVAWLSKAFWYASWKQTKFQSTYKNKILRQTKVLAQLEN